MKPQFLKVFKDLTHSFNARVVTRPDINNHWHYHPEFELIYFKSGFGTQFVGDNISSFKAGDIVLLGANLPHYWQFDQCYFDKENGTQVDVCVVQFNETFWGDTFLNLPENLDIKSTLQTAKRGIKISGEISDTVGKLIERIITSEGSRKIMSLMEVLLSIGDSKQSYLLASIGFQHNFQEAEKDRINAIYHYTIDNFKKKISLEEISEVANMSSNSFCKFFKSRSHKTYSQFINEIRVGYACKLLIENNLHVKEVCYESGFNNFASFHKFFKAITGKSPLNYQKSFSGEKNKI